MKTKIPVLGVIFSLILNLVPSVYAYEFPNTFWSMNNSYDAAIDSGNYSGIIKYGEQILNLMSSEPDTSEKRDVMVTRYKEVGLAYAALEEYDKAAQIFTDMYNYASQYDKYWEYAKTAKTRLNQYTSAISVYTDKGSSTYYGAKNEKDNGVLYGVCYTSGTRSKLEDESMVLIYQELGESLPSYNEEVLEQASKSGIAVEYALNCPNEADDIENIQSFKSNLQKISALLKRYSDVPVYLRFAAEFDIWSNLTDADSFKTAYRYVASYLKSNNSNVAMVWSPNQVSNWNIDIEDFYPGDEYVDWVGMSLYASKYFLGDKTQTEDNEIIFKSGVNSDPVIAVKDVMEKYGDKKPIMISECGCGHTVISSKEDAGDFALQRLKEYYYYLPMVYPQIKLIAYFDAYVSGGNEKNDYRLSTNSEMQSEFLKITQGSRFIQDKYSNSTSFCYRKISDGTTVDGIFPVACYAHRYNTDVTQVTYFIDDKYVGMSSEIPFDTYIDASGYSGSHTLKAVAAFSNGKTLTSESQISINKSNTDVKVKISGKQISFDQNPIIYNDRTMVPMRKIFEELGATVSWDGDTSTASAVRGARTVKISVGSNKMYVNDTEITLDAPSFILADRTLVPVRAIAEGMGCDVDWISASSTVTIEPKEFEWSDWEESLPSGVTEDLYYIETKSQYRERTREREYFTLSYKDNSYDYVSSDVSYGSWSDWSTDYVAASDSLDVETRTQSSPEKYHFAHYCTGKNDNPSYVYQTSSKKFCDEASYHDLGWFDSKLSEAGDVAGTYIQYDSSGNKVKCSNGCYRWYLVETSGGTYTEYRSRTVKREYKYQRWGSWSSWSDWQDGSAPSSGDSAEYDTRTLYRYKEK